MVVGNKDSCGSSMLHFLSMWLAIDEIYSVIKYDKQDQQGKAAFNEPKPYLTQQQEPYIEVQKDKKKEQRAKTL
jgi:hypothetical protein